MDSARSCQCSDSLALSHRGSGEEPAGNRLLAGNPNPSPASRKPGDLLGSAAPEAREGFGYGFGPESALGSLSAHPGPFSTDRPLLGPPQLLPRDRSIESSPRTGPRGIFGIFFTGKEQLFTSSILPVPWQLSCCWLLSPRQLAGKHGRAWQTEAAALRWGTGAQTRTHPPVNPILLLPV